MQAYRTGKIGRADRGDKVLTGRGQVGKKTGRQARLGRKNDQKDKQTQDRHYGQTFWMSTQNRKKRGQADRKRQTGQYYSI
jgi:hypothetical protein